MPNEFVARKGLISSGSLRVSGSVTASFISGALTGTFPYTGLTNLPALVSSSTQIDYNSIQNKLSGVISSSTQVATLLPASTVSSSTASSPSQGTVRVTINGVNTDVDTGLQTGDSPTFTGLTVDTNTLYVDATNDRVGIGTITPNIRLAVNGNTNITGSLDVTAAFTAQTKSFKIKHQTQLDKSLIYGVLEGPEHGVYVRGRLTNNNTIILPPEWDWLIDTSSITVHLTPVGSHQKLYVDTIVNNVIFIKNENLINKNIDCFYIVHATRKDVEPLKTVQ